jgi:hypothetical protein
MQKNAIPWVSSQRGNADKQTNTNARVMSGLPSEHYADAKTTVVTHHAISDRTNLPDL